MYALDVVREKHPQLLRSYTYIYRAFTRAASSRRLDLIEFKIAAYRTTNASQQWYESILNPTCQKSPIQTWRFLNKANVNAYANVGPDLEN